MNRPRLRLIKSFPNTRSDLERLDLGELKTIQSSSECPPYLAGWISEEIEKRQQIGFRSPNTPGNRMPPRRPA